MSARRVFWRRSYIYRKRRKGTFVGSAQCIFFVGFFLSVIARDMGG